MKLRGYGLRAAWLRTQGHRIPVSSSLSSARGLRPAARRGFSSAKTCLPGSRSS